MVYRVYVEKKQGLEAEARDLYDRGLLEKGYCAFGFEEVKSAED